MKLRDEFNIIYAAGFEHGALTVITLLAEGETVHDTMLRVQEVVRTLRDGGPDA